MVFRTLQRLCGADCEGRDRIEDLAQEVFLRLYRGLPLFQGDAKLSTYLYRIVVNVAQDEWKRRRRERGHRAPGPWDPADGEERTDWIETVPSREPDAEQQLSRRQTLAAVDQALTELPEAERTVIVLYHQEECSYEHIALTLNLPLGTVRTHLHRGRARLAGLVRAALARVPRPEVAAGKGMVSR